MFPVLNQQPSENYNFIFKKKAQQEDSEDLVKKIEDLKRELEQKTAIITSIQRNYDSMSHNFKNEKNEHNLLKEEFVKMRDAMADMKYKYKDLVKLKESLEYKLNNSDNISQLYEESQAKLNELQETHRLTVDMLEILQNKNKNLEQENAELINKIKEQQ